MAYNLRSRVRNNLLAEEREEDLGGSDSSEEDHVSEQSESSESDSSDYSEAEDVENQTLSERVLRMRENAAARGRPSTSWTSKNKTKWKIGAPERLSGWNTFLYIYFSISTYIFLLILFSYLYFLYEIRFVHIIHSYSFFLFILIQIISLIACAIIIYFFFLRKVVNTKINIVTWNCEQQHKGPVTLSETFIRG